MKSAFLIILHRADHPSKNLTTILRQTFSIFLWS